MWNECIDGIEGTTMGGAKPIFKSRNARVICSYSLRFHVLHVVDSNRIADEDKIGDSHH